VGEWTFRRDGAHKLAQCVAVSLLAAAVFGTVVHARLDQFEGNYSGFLRVERARFDNNPLVGGRDEIRRSLVLVEDGYDAQYMYFVAYDPLLRAFHDHPGTYDRIVDTPPYRYGRIGFTWLTLLFSLGNWQYYPTVMVWLVVLGLATSCGLLARIAQRRGRSSALGLLPLMIPGFWTSLQLGLPEPIAAAALLCGIYLVERDEVFAAGLAFAASTLIRETGVIAVACVVAGLLIARRPRDAFRLGATSLLPIAAWRLYVGSVLHREWGLQAYIYLPPTGLPMKGIFDLWHHIAARSYFPGTPDIARAGLTFPWLLIVGFVLAVLLSRSSLSAMRMAAILYGISALSLTYVNVWVHVANAQRTSYELFMTMAVATISMHDEAGWLKRLVAGWWWAVGLYAMFAAYDAGFIFNSVTGF
jgi:hypothetical protein